MAEIKLLDSLTKGKWEQIVVSGGRLERSSSGTYLLSGLWILNAQKWIALSAIERNEETFFLGLFEEDTSPIPEKSKMFHPSRQHLSECPKDCPLTDLTISGIKSASVKSVNMTDEYLEIESPLVIEANNGRQFVFTASDAFPEMIEIECIM
ncbi:hypothetical protein [Sneathiella sp.]|uniref:hypothetical protein n=1 Tax=Sneathiella sp. TaxID=1964365 RepID=UPI0035695AEC